MKKDDDFKWVVDLVRRPFRLRNGLYLPAIKSREIKGHKVPVIAREKKDLLNIKVKVPFIKKTIYTKKIFLDNKIPGIIQDTFDNLGYVTKDNQRPKIIAKNRYVNGDWFLKIDLPPGIAYRKLKTDHEYGYFSDATKCFVELNWVKGYVEMIIHFDDLPEMIEFNWDPRPYLDKMALPWPIGYTHGGKLIVVDLAKFPHCLTGGATNFGKSSFITCLIYALLLLDKYAPGRVRVAVADPKGTDFYQLDGLVMYVEEEPVILRFLTWLSKEHDRRKKILRKHGIKKIQHYKGNDLPYIVFVIDEFAELRDKNINAMINRAVRLFRVTGIHIVTATQRPSIVGGVMDGDTRGQFTARVCFKVACETDSRMILGDTQSQAAWLPGDIPGRAFYNFNIDSIMIQSMFITEKKEQELLRELKGNGGWDFDTTSKRLSARQ